MEDPELISLEQIPEKFRTPSLHLYFQKQEVYDALVEAAQRSGNPGRFESELTRRHQELLRLTEQWATEVLALDTYTLN